MRVLQEWRANSWNHSVSSPWGPLYVEAVHAADRTQHGVDDLLMTLGEHGWELTAVIDTCRTQYVEVTNGHAAPVGRLTAISYLLKRPSSEAAASELATCRRLQGEIDAAAVEGVPTSPESRDGRRESVPISELRSGMAFYQERLGAWAQVQRISQRQDGGWLIEKQDGGRVYYDATDEVIAVLPADFSTD